VAILIVGLLFIILAGIVSAFGYHHYVKPTRLIDQLTTTTSDVIPSPFEKDSKPKLSFSQVLEPIGNMLPVSPQDALATKQELISAGLRSRSAVPVYYGAKIVLAIGMVILGLTFRDRVHNRILSIVLPVASAGMGYFLPSLILGRLVKRRREQIRFALPDVLDLLVVCSEAGCGLDQSMVNVCRELKVVHPAVAEELSFVNMEIMAGKGRADALRNFGRRTGEDEVKKLTAILIQTDRFGTSVSDALRTQSDFLRIRRRQEAEERAGKVGVKLVFPIFFFCLPSLLVVTAGPGMLQLFNNLFPMMNRLH
jgi:tight adherence protein C